MSFLNHARGVKKSYWSRTGIAFENTDGSYNLQFDYFFPTNVHPTNIQAARL